MASLLFNRGSKETLEQVPITDGQLLFETDNEKNNKIYLDNGDKRVQVGTVGEAKNSILNSEGMNIVTADNVQDGIGQLDFILNKANIARLVVDAIYPVGSIYLETTNTNPASKLGGTWVAYGASDTYLRLGGNGSGGSNSVKLVANQIPSITTGNQSANHTHSFSHTHGIPSLSGSTNEAGTHTHNVITDYRTVSPGAGNTFLMNLSTMAITTKASTTENGAHTHTVTTNASTTNSQSTTTTGNNSANHTHTYTNNNQQNVSVTPKYVQVYAWKRTA